MRIKICGITQPEQGMAIAQLGATALGFICVSSSPRHVTPSQIRRITQPLMNISAIPNSIDRVGVFANADLNTISETVATGLLNVVQLHGDEPLAFCQQVKESLPSTEVIKAFRIRDQDALAQTYNYTTVVDTILLDAYHPTILGGTGHTLDWSLLKSFTPNCPWILAGGLNPENVADAIAQVHPDGIDLSSGVENTPGNKNLEKVRHLFQQIQIGLIQKV